MKCSPFGNIPKDTKIHSIQYLTHLVELYEFRIEFCFVKYSKFGAFLNKFLLFNNSTEKIPTEVNLGNRVAIPFLFSSQ